MVDGPRDVGGRAAVGFLGKGLSRPITHVFGLLEVYGIVHHLAL